MGDRDAEFLEYVTAHRGRMLRTARLLASGDAHWAEDLVQAALTKLYVHWSKVRREDGAARYADPDKRKPPVIPATAVPLVANTKPFPGVITCDLIPKGWAARIAFSAPGAQQQLLYDPNLDTKKYHEATYTVTIRQTRLMDEGQGLTVDKYSTPWTKLPKVRAGKYQAVTSGVPGSPYGRQEVFVKPGKGIAIVGVDNNAYNLAWDMNTLLKFAGSCHYK